MTVAGKVEHTVGTAVRETLVAGTDPAIPDTDGEPRWFTLRLEYQKDKEMFYIILELDGRKIAMDNFFAEDGTACLMIDRFVETLEGCL